MKILFIVNNPAEYTKMVDYFENQGHEIKITHNIKLLINEYNVSLSRYLSRFDEVLVERNTANYSFSELLEICPNVKCIDTLGSIRNYLESKEPYNNDATSLDNEVVKSGSKSLGTQQAVYKRVSQKPIQTEEKAYWKGKTKLYQLLYAHIDKFSSILDNFLLVGESGTGKEHIALEIHKASGVSGEFVSIDCGALTDELFASALFGHIKGSFTGAYTGNTGYLEKAYGGTLFLDEVENLSFKGQISLLRVLQERVFYKVGSTQAIQMNCKVICSTNVDLEDLVQKKRFRLDLYHRINQITLKVPALKDINSDIPELIEFLIKEISNLYKVNFYEVDKIKKQAVKELYPYPGNIRQLKHWLINKAFENEDIYSNLHGIELMRTGRLY